MIFAIFELDHFAALGDLETLGDRLDGFSLFAHMVYKDKLKIRLLTDNGRDLAAEAGDRLNNFEIGSKCVNESFEVIDGKIFVRFFSAFEDYFYFDFMASSQKFSSLFFFGFQILALDTEGKADRF